jgi:mono/diheme cytochrome c family protein
MIRLTVTVPTALLAAAIAATAFTPMPVRATMAAKPSAALISEGKAIAASNCAKCHGTDLAGMEGFTPKLTPTGPMRHYTTAALFERMLAKGVDEKDQPLAKPMSSIRLPAPKAAAVYAYLKTL